MSDRPIVEPHLGDVPAELVVEDLIVGEGEEAQPGQTAVVHYVGVGVASGEEFDASWNRGEPFSFPLGAGHVIAGWDQGGHEAELKSLAAELGLSFSDVRSQKSEDSDRISDLRPPTSVVFLGPQFGDAKAACYHYSDAFILPSFSEGVPMAVLEAWVNSKPVLMTPQCNLPEGFSSSAALKMEPTVESVTNGLNEFWRMTDAERTAMGTRGYALAAGRFVWPRIAEQMKELYEWMLGGGSRPACLADF